MKRMILKCKLRDRDAFEDKLGESDLDFGAIYWQHDRVYVPRGYKPGNNYPRLVMRTTMLAVDEPPRYSLILRRHIEDSGVDIVEDTPVIDYANTVNIILQLGFRLAKEVSRRRQTVITDKGITIHLDELDGIEDVYAKIEADLKDGTPVAEVKSSLTSTLESFGETDLVAKSYFEL